jgi:AcrR family transcriptional regulator
MSRAAARPAPRLARADRIDHILRAARDLFDEKGYEQTAVSGIAARLGIAEGTVFKYFPTKRELLLKVLEHWYEDMFGDYARLLAGVTGARARLRFLIWRHLKSVHDNPLLCRLMFREVRSEQDYRGSGLHQRNRRYTQFLLDVIRDGVEAGDFRDDISPILLRDLVYGGIEHHAWTYLCGRGALDVDHIADQLTAVLCEGIEPREALPLQREVRRLSQRVARMERGAKAHRSPA